MLRFKHAVCAVITSLGVLLPRVVAQALKPPDSTEILLSELTVAGLDATKVLLQAHIQVKGYAPIDGMHGFLMKVPGGLIVAVVPWLSFGDLDLAAPGSQLKAWYLDAAKSSTAHISIDRSYLPASVLKSRQFTIAHVSAASKAEYSATVVTAELTPPQPGQLVYCVCAEDKSIDGQMHAGPVRAFKAQIVELNRHEQKGDISFGFFGKVDVQSLHSGLLVDKDCKVVGILNGYYPEATHGNQVCGRAFQVGTLLDGVDLPPADVAIPPTEPATLPTPEAAADKPPAPSPAVSPAATGKSVDDPAAKAFRVATMYESSEQYVPARKKLQQIIELYPSSPSAESARAELKKIEGR